MANNTLPSGIHHLMGLARRIANGLETYGPWLRLTQTPADGFRGALEELEKAETVFGTARAAKAHAGTAAVAADAALTAWLGKARLVMMLVLGGTWSEHWIETGFTHRGTNVPKRSNLRIGLARLLMKFLSDHPEYAVPFAQVTSEGAHAIFDRSTEAQTKLRRLTADCIEKKRARDGAERVLRRKMRQVILLLSGMITAEDPRWLAFGLNQPRRAAYKRRRAASAQSELISLEPIELPRESQAPQGGSVAA